MKTNSNLPIGTIYDSTARTIDNNKLSFIVNIVKFKEGIIKS